MTTTHRNMSLLHIVLDYITKRFPDVVSIKEITNFVWKNHKSVLPKNKLKKELRDDIFVYCHRLYKSKKTDPKIVKIGVGLYKAVTTIDNIHLVENPPLELHGIKIEGYLQKGIQTIAFLQLNNYRETTNFRHTKKEVFLGRVVTITIHKKGLVEIFVNASNNPFDPVEFNELCNILFEGYFSGLGVISQKRCRQWDIAKDFVGLRLDGVKAVTLRSFRNAMLKVYYHEKKSATRVEARLTTELSLSNALELIGNLAVKPVGKPVGFDVKKSSNGVEVA